MLYHCLLVGLQDLSPEAKQKLTADELETQIRENLSSSDLKAFDLLCMKAENDEEALLMYQKGMASKNAFVRDWFAFNLNLNNILTAAICRKHGFNVRKAIVGEGEVQDALRTSNAKDFGLSATLPEIDDILRLSEVEDLYEREKKTDALRWAWLEDRTLFNYFEAENVFAYWLEAQMLNRWNILNKEEGARIFRELIADMKRDIHFDKNK